MQTTIGLLPRVIASVLLVVGMTHSASAQATTQGYQPDRTILPMPFPLSAA
jgi:hypothetical protein